MVHTLIVLAIIGFAAFLVITYVPMPAVFRQVFIAICALFAAILVLNFVGIDTGVHTRL